MKTFQGIFKLQSGHKIKAKIFKRETIKTRRQELSLLYAIHYHDLFYISVWYHENISEGIKVTERTRNHGSNYHGEITKMKIPRVIIRVCDTDLFFTFMKYHENISTWIHAKQRTQGCQKDTKVAVIQKVWARFTILYSIHRHNLFYTNMKNH